MSSIYWYECRIEEAKQKIASLEEELSNLYSMKNEVSNGADTIQGQIRTKREASNNLLNLESRLPLVNSLNLKVQKNIDNTFEYKVLDKFTAVKEEVILAIHKVKDEIEEQKEIIRQCELAIIRIQEEERRKEEEKKKDKN